MNDFENNNNQKVLQTSQQEATYDEYIEARYADG
jgi:hypothetical protein